MLVGAEVFFERYELQRSPLARSQIVLVPVQHLRLQTSHRGVCLLPGRARLQAGSELVVCALAFSRARRADRRVDIGLAWQRESRPKYANDCVRLAFHQNRLAKYLRVTCEGCAPELVADDHRVRAALTVFLRGEAAPHHGQFPQDIEEASRNPRRKNAADASRRAYVGSRPQACEARNRRQYLGYLIADQFPGFAIDGRRSVRSVLVRDHFDTGKAIRLRIGQRAQQKRIDQAEHGCIRANAERQSEDDRECITGRLSETAKSDAQRDEGHGKPRASREDTAIASAAFRQIFAAGIA